MAKGVKTGGLTPKQAQFVREYLIDLNGTQAAIRAGYSKKTARFIAEENLTKPNIAGAIEVAMEERAKRTEVTADRVLEELALVGFFRVGECLRIQEDGDAYIDLSKASPEQLAALSEIQTEDVVDGRGEDSRLIRKVKVKFHDKLSALEKVGRHLGMFVAGNEMFVNGELIVRHVSEPIPTDIDPPSEP